LLDLDAMFSVIFIFIFIAAIVVVVVFTACPFLRRLGTDTTGG
jgi:hypothetical protein